jgi:hypothetical protein
LEKVIGVVEHWNNGVMKEPGWWSNEKRNRKIGFIKM